MPDVTVIIVSYNTRELTLTAIGTLLANAGPVVMRVVVWDNASSDGSADAIAARFPQVDLVRSADNIGFARANNAVAADAETEWLLLLNPDTETRPGAVASLLEFAGSHPQAGIVGGRTLFADGSLNPASCWNRMTMWNQLCSAIGLSRRFPDSALFNHEGIGGWRRDSVRHVDIVVGCFLMIPTRLWRELGGFDPRYFMYGEEADLCLRAARSGYRPMITPDAEIVHHVGASTSRRLDSLSGVMRAKATLIGDHWHWSLVPVGLGLLALWSAVRCAASGFSADRDERALWRSMWRTRREWLAGY